MSSPQLSRRYSTLRALDRMARILSRSFTFSPWRTKESNCRLSAVGSSRPAMPKSMTLPAMAASVAASRRSREDSTRHRALGNSSMATSWLLTLRSR